MANTALDREAVDEAVSRGSDLLKQGKLEEAQKAFRAALHLDGENPRILALLGLTHFRAGQFPQARPIYEELVERAPTDASHRLNLGLVYLKLGESDKAIGSLEASRALDPSQGRAVSYLGLAYARAGRYAEAYRSFLLAGQNDLATEIEVNLTASERAGIHAQLERSGVAPEAPRTKPPKQPPRRTPEHGVGHVLPPVETTPQVSMPAIRVDKEALRESPPQPGLESSAAIVIDRPPLFSSVAIPIDVDRNEGSASIPIEMSSSIAIPIDTDETKPRQSSGLSEAEIALGRLDHATGTATPVTEIKAPQMTDSLQFVLPEREAVPTPAQGQSIISRAVEVASPSTAAAAAAAAGSKVGWGNTPPVPLSQLATEQLIRPDDGDSAFEVTSTGALVIRVSDRIHTRLEGIHITGGNLEFEPAMRRSRGHQTDDKFNYGAAQLHTVSGEGYLIATPGDRKFTAVALDDDILYLREDLVFAFESTLRWENGNVPGLRGKLPVVQFRGDGAVALRSAQSLVRVKLPAAGVLFVDATRLAGWIGRVIPRAVVPPKHGPMGDVCVECTGEGVVLIDPGVAAPPMPGERARNPSNPGASRSSGPVGSAVKAAPPPPPSSGQEISSPAIELDVVKSADWLSDDDKEELAGDDAKPDEI